MHIRCMQWVSRLQSHKLAEPSQQSHDKQHTVIINTFMNSDAVFMKKSITQTDITVIQYYQKAIRSLMYNMLQIHSDIIFTVFTVN